MAEESQRRHARQARRCPNGQPFAEPLETPARRRRIRRPLARARATRARGPRFRACADRRIACSATTREFGVRSTWFGEASLQGSSRPSHLGRRRRVSAGSIRLSRELPQFDYRFSTPVGVHAGRDQDQRHGGRWRSARAPTCTRNMAFSRRLGSRCSRGPQPAGLFASGRRNRRICADALHGGNRRDRSLTRATPSRSARRTCARGVAGRHARRRSRRGDRHRVRLDRASASSTPSSSKPATSSCSMLPRAPRTGGTELLVRYRREGFVALATHAWTRSTELDPDCTCYVGRCRSRRRMRVR